MNMVFSQGIGFENSTLISPPKYLVRVWLPVGCLVQNGSESGKSTPLRFIKRVNVSTNTGEEKEGR